VDRTLQVSSGNAGTDDGGGRQVAVGLHGQFEVVDGLRDEDAVERQNDAVVILDMRSEMVVRFGSMVVVFEVRMRHDLVATGAVRAVHVLHRRQRQAGQGGDETQRDGAKQHHDSDATTD
jgi:hypothetical protein